MHGHQWERVLALRRQHCSKNGKQGDYKSLRQTKFQHVAGSESHKEIIYA
jgi:hypothetical protein